VAVKQASRLERLCRADPGAAMPAAEAEFVAAGPLERAGGCRGGSGARLTARAPAVCCPQFLAFRLGEVRGECSQLSEVLAQTQVRQRG
jgi:hypothetical protein